MSLRIWLNATGTKAVETEEKTRGSSGELYEARLLDGFTVETDGSSGQMYIHFHVDPLDPAASMPCITRKYVRRVSYTGKYFEGFRPDGIYRYKGATARVETIEDSDGYGENQFNRRYQNISISAGSIRTLREIYTKVRSGEVRVKQDWSLFQHEVEAREAAAEEAADAAETTTAH